MSVIRSRPASPADRVHEVLRASLLVDGFDLVLDLERSHGRRLVDQRDGTSYLDMFGFFASSALGMNHPDLADGRRRSVAELATAAVNKPSNSDIYTVPMARFVRRVRAGARRPGAAAPVLRRRRGAGRRERAQGRVRLEEPAQRGARARPGARHQGAAPDATPSTVAADTRCR